MDSLPQIEERLRQTELRLARMSEHVKRELGNANKGNVHRLIEGLNTEIERFTELDKKFERIQLIMNALIAVVSAVSVGVIGTVLAAITNRFMP